jgi:hypothetical protein
VIDLRGLPKGRFTLKITLTTSDDPKITSSRTYHIRPILRRTSTLASAGHFALHGKTLVDEGPDVDAPCESGYLGRRRAGTVIVTLLAERWTPRLVV